MAGSGGAKSKWSKAIASAKDEVAANNPGGAKGQPKWVAAARTVVKDARGRRKQLVHDCVIDMARHEARPDVDRDGDGHIDRIDWYAQGLLMLRVSASFPLSSDPPPPPQGRRKG